MRFVAFSLLGFALSIAIVVHDACAQSDATLEPNASAVGAAIGLRVGGGGETRTEIDTGFGSASDQDDYTDESGMLITAWLTQGLSPQLGIGLRAAYIGNVEVDDENGGSNFDVGSQIDLRARGDYGIAVPSATKLQIHIVGEAGTLLILPDGDLEDLYQSLNLEPKIRPGLGIGAGAGVSFQVTERIALRADLLGEYLAVNLLHEEGNSLSSRGTRFWLLAGAQF